MLSRRTFLKTGTALSAVAAAGRSLASGRPVILDTDIGDDIDDTWALLMLLRIPELDLKLAVSDYGNAIYRCRLLAKLLQLTGRTDVPIGVGVGREDEAGQQSGWVGDYQLDDYPGVIIEDGVQAIIDTIHASPEPVILLCIGPAPNIAAALERDPAIADNAQIIGMYGSIYAGYTEDEAPAAEWNVRVDPGSLQTVFAAPWGITITPLDTCGRVVLDGAGYRSLFESDDPWLKALMENYAAWLPGAPYMDPDTDVSRTSSTLFDTVAVYLAAEQDLLEMETLSLRVTDDGYTVIDTDHGRPVNCAVAWKDLSFFKSELVRILLG
jgi:inosine-uridine nucleoside N-ribohydrolase